MSDSAPPSRDSHASPLRAALLGAVLGALQPPLMAAIAQAMSVEAPLDPVAGLRAGLPASVPYAVVAAVVGVLAQRAWVRFGRDSLLPIVLTYAFLSSAILLFTYLTPS